MQYTFPPGSRLGVRVHGLILHEGIASDRFIGHEQGVFSCSRRAGEVREEPLSIFAGDNRAVVLDRLSELDATEVLRKARVRLGRPWRVVAYNCEHFTRECFGVPPRSPQVIAGFALAAVCLGVVVGTTRRR